MVSKSFITYAFLLGFTTSVNAQAAISPGNGVTAAPPPAQRAVLPGEGVPSVPPPPQLNVRPGEGVTGPPTSPELFVRPGEGVTSAPPPPRRAVLPGEGVTSAPPSPRLNVRPGEGVTSAPPPSQLVPPPPQHAAPDTLPVRAIDAKLLVDRALASSAKAIFQSVLNDIKSAKSPPGNPVTAAPPPAQPVAPPGNGVTGTPPPPQPVAPDALPVRAINAEILADRALASSAKAVFQSVLNGIKSSKSPPGNPVTAAPPPAQPVAPPGNGVTAPPPPAQPVAPPGNGVTPAPPPSQPAAPDALPVRAFGAGAANANRRRASSKRTCEFFWVGSVVRKTC